MNILAQAITLENITETFPTYENRGIHNQSRYSMIAYSNQTYQVGNLVKFFHFKWAKNQN